MNERKWTPGPWFAVRNSVFWEINPKRNRGDDHIPYAVGDVCASDPGDTTGLQEANANLIAAAPELYEALMAQDPFNEGLNNNNPDKHEHESSQDFGERIAIAALAKARGEK